MSTSRLVAAGMLVATVGFISTGTQGQVLDPVAGPWEQISAKNLTTGVTAPRSDPPPYLIYGHGYFVTFTAAAGRAKTQAPREKMTREELLDQRRQSHE